MAAEEADIPVLQIGEALGLYYDLLQQSKELEQEVRLLRDRILRSLSDRRIDRIQADGYEAERQVRHHAPRLVEDKAEEILERHGRLEECMVQVLDVDRAREVIDELFRHGSISKDELPYIYVKPTEALLVHPLAPPEATREERRAA